MFTYLQYPPGHVLPRMPSLMYIIYTRTTSQMLLSPTIQFHKRSCLTLKAVFVVVAESYGCEWRVRFPGFSQFSAAGESETEKCMYVGGRGRGVTIPVLVQHRRWHGITETCLTPSLSCHLKATNKSAEFETLNCFCLLFRTGMWKNFHRNA